MADREIDKKNSPKKGVALDVDWEIINVGLAPNDGTGDPIRDAMVKVNKNFANIFTQDNSANANAAYTWTNVNTFEANVFFNGNTSANVQIITTDEGYMDVRFFTKRVYFGGGNSSLEGAELVLGFKGDTPEKELGNWTIDVFGYSDEKVSFKNALRIYNYDKNGIAHPFMHVNPVEDGTFEDTANAVFGLSEYPDSIPFNVTFARDIGPWKDKLQNFGSTTNKWNSIFAYNLYDISNSRGSSNQILSSTGDGIKWINQTNDKPTKIINQSFIGDGVTRNFTITGGYTPGLVNVFLNGIRMTPGVDIDITLGTDVVFTDPPELGMSIDVSGALMMKLSVDTSLPYTWTANQEFAAGIIAGGSIGRNGQILASTGTSVKWVDYAPGPISPSTLVKANINQSFIGDGTTKTFTITGGYTAGQLNVFLNGVRMSTSVEVDVSSGSTITFVNAPEKGMPIDTVGALFSNTTVDTSVAYNWTANQNFASNVSIVGLKANGSLGSAGQVLTTNGSGVYWAAGGGGGGSVNTDAQYTWTNNHTFLDNVVINSSSNAYGLSVDSSRSNFYGIYVKASNSAALAAFGDRAAITCALSNSAAFTRLGCIEESNNTLYSIQAYAAGYFAKDVELGEGLVANGSQGTAGQVLTTDGNKVYWGSGGGSGSVNTAAQYTWTNTHTFLNNMIINSAAAAIGLSVDSSRSNFFAIVAKASNSAAISAIGDFTALRSSLSNNAVTTRISHANTTNGKIYSIHGDGEAFFAKDLELGEGLVANGSQGTAGQILTTDGNKVYWSANRSASRIYNSNAQSLPTDVFTKIALNTVQFDTLSCFVPATNRLVPQIPGYYMVNWAIGFDAGSVNSWNTAALFVAMLYKNGSLYQGASVTPTNKNILVPNGSTIVQLNGSTDYLELYGFHAGSGISIPIYPNPPSNSGATVCLTFLRGL